MSGWWQRVHDALVSRRLPRWSGNGLCAKECALTEHTAIAGADGVISLTGRENVSSGGSLFCHRAESTGGL